MSKYFAGIEPLEKGYDVISVKPNFGNLSKITSAVTTIKGNIQLQAEKLENELILKVDLPTKTKIAIEKMSNNPEILWGNEVFYQNGKTEKNKKISYDSEDEKYIYFYVENGAYEFCSK